MAQGGAGASRRRRAREDRQRIYIAKTIRAVAYGALSAFLYLYLVRDLGYSSFASLVLTALTLVGAAAWSLLALPPIESWVGRRRALFLFSGLFTASAALLFLFSQPAVVIIALLLGGVAAASADNAPLGSLDQAILPSTARRVDQPAIFAWYNLLANFAAAGGAALLLVPGALDPRAVPGLPAAPHPWIALIYLTLAAATWVTYAGISKDIDNPSSGKELAGAPLTAETRSHLTPLAALFAVDSLAGGFVINPLIAAYFVLVWHASDALVGGILFGTGLVAGFSFIAAGWLAGRFGLLRTMVFTHLPSNLLLIVVPFMPTLSLALGVLVARSGLSQMDVPTRQAYTMALVSRRERARIAGTLSGVRAIGQSPAPFLAAAVDSAGLYAVPFVVAGSLKVAYDLALWQRFRRVALPAEERPDEAGSTSSPSERPD